MSHPNFQPISKPWKPLSEKQCNRGECLKMQNKASDTSRCGGILRSQYSILYLKLIGLHRNILAGIHCSNTHSEFSVLLTRACPLLTSTSRLRATSVKFSCCSNVLSILSSVIQKQRSRASIGSCVLAKMTNLAM